MTYSLGFMRKFGLIGQVMSKYPDQNQQVLRDFCSFEHASFLISKIPVLLMAITIHMVNRIREESQEREFSDFEEK